MSGTVPGTSIPWSGVNAAGAAAGASAAEVVTRLVAPGVAIEAVEPLRDAAVAAAEAASENRAAAEAAAETAGAAQQGAVGAATAAVNASTAADTARLTAEAAAAAAMLNQGMFPTVSAGLSATADGGYFTVPGTGSIYATLYRKESGVAVLIGNYYSREGVDAAVAAEAAARAGVIQQTPAVSVSGIDVSLMGLDQFGRAAPFQATDGRLIQPNASGTFERVPLRSEVEDLAADAATEAAEDAVGDEAAAREAVIAQITDVVVGGVTTYIGALDSEGKFAPLMDAAARHVQALASGEFERVPTRAEVAEIAATVVPTPPAEPTPTYAYNDAAFSYVPTARTHLHILLQMGQSNSNGTNGTTEALVAATPLYASDALMLEGGVRQQGTVRTSFVPLVETTTSTQRETAASGIINHLIAKLDADGLARQKFCTINFGAGGREIAELGRGWLIYQRFLATLANTVSLAKAQGWTPIVRFCDWMQGEADMSRGTQMGDYAARVTTLQRWLSEDVRAITGQREEVIMIITPIANTSDNPIRTTTFDHRIWEAYRLLRSHPYVRFAPPIYPLPYCDNIHLSCVGQNRRGIGVSRVIYEDFFRYGWRGFYPERIRWTGATTIQADFTVPEGGNLVMDTSGAVVSTTGLPGYLGFRFTDGTGSPPTITGHNISGRSLTLTLSAPPAGYGSCILAYASQRNADNTTDQDGPLIGARGCLRGSTSRTSLYDGAVNHIWCPHFIHDIGRP